jgi:hypothetical protein
VSNNILATEQYCFRENVSRESAIFKLAELIFSARNNKEYTMGLFCDLTKVFDCVRHELLILKLEFYGVKGSILHWFKSYLLNRRHCIILQFVNSPHLLLDLEIDMVLLGDLFWAHYCSTCILIIFHAAQIKSLIPFFLQMTLILLFIPAILMTKF